MTNQQALERAGVLPHTARYLAHLCTERKWTPDEFNRLLRVSKSSTIRSAPAFLTHRIKSDIRPDTTTPLRDTGCDTCHAYPCLCGWDPDKESLAQFKARVYQMGGNDETGNEHHPGALP